MLHILSNCELSFLTSDRNHPPKVHRIKHRSRSHARFDSRRLFQEIFTSISSVFCMRSHFQQVPLLTARYFRDTVSSVGFIRGRTLPGTDNPNPICFFRHALALDERRVKFLPEYARGGVCLPEKREPAQDDVIQPSQHVKEIWFAGTHSDMYVCFPTYFRQSSLMRCL